MTDKEKAQAYDEAPKQAKFYHGNCPSEPERKKLEGMFPELRESEDERMIKAIEHILYENYSDAAVIEGVEIAEIVTWLEKLKEPIDPFDTKLFRDGVKEGRRLEREDIKKEPIPIPDKFSGLKSLMLQYLQSAANRTDDTEIESDTDLWGRKILDYVWKYSEKQKEQKESTNSGKPKEWSEEDKTNGWTGVDLERYLSCLQRLGTGNPQQPETINSKWFKEHCRPQPKQEWSEEDEKNLELVIDCIYKFYPDPVMKYKLKEWLKSLRPQSKENPKCEDCPNRGNTHQYLKGSKEGNRELALSFMAYLDENRPEGKMCLSNGECADIEKAFIEHDWDKIMRYANKYQPSWKPSEKQMKQ